jgi:uncharacterized protein
MPLLLCPNCNASMQNVQRSGVELDMCPTCRGVWLDRGELEKILEGARATVGADVQSRERFDREVQDFHRNPEEWKQRHPYDSRDKRHHYDDDHYRHHKKKRGFDLFDIFD